MRVHYVEKACGWVYLSASLVCQGKSKKKNVLSFFSNKLFNKIQMSQLLVGVNTTSLSKFVALKCFTILSLICIVDLFDQAHLT